MCLKSFDLNTQNSMQVTCNFMFQTEMAIEKQTLWIAATQKVGIIYF